MPVESYTQSLFGQRPTNSGWEWNTGSAPVSFGQTPQLSGGPSGGFGRRNNQYSNPFLNRQMQGRGRWGGSFGPSFNSFGGSMPRANFSAVGRPQVESIGGPLGGSPYALPPQYSINPFLSGMVPAQRPQALPTRNPFIQNRAGTIHPGF